MSASKSITTDFMRRAIALSQNGYPAPNPHVGCVIVRAEGIVGEGWHDYAGGPHAEIVAIEQAGEAARGATMFVTLEPCNHHGRTPPCAEAILRAGIESVVIACEDPNPIARGGAARLRREGMEVTTGLLSEEAAAANRSWMTAMRLERPYVALKAAITLDGYLARSDGSSKWITGEEARKRARLLRAEMGAVLVGSNTILLDDPALTARDPNVRNEPLRVILDPAARLSGNESVFCQPGSTLRLVANGKSRWEEDVEIHAEEGRFEISDVLQSLFERGVTSLLVEGGAHTIGRFLRAGTWDELNLFLAPKAFGEGRPWHGGAPIPNLKMVQFEPFEDDIWIRYEKR